MSAKRTSGALMTSLVLHLVLAFVAGIYLITQTPHFRELIGAEIIQTDKTTEAYSTETCYQTTY